MIDVGFTTARFGSDMPALASGESGSVEGRFNVSSSRQYYALRVSYSIFSVLDSVVAFESVDAAMKKERRVCGKIMRSHVSQTFPQMPCSGSRCCVPAFEVNYSALAYVGCEESVE